MEIHGSLLYSGVQMGTEKMGRSVYERDKQLGDIHWIRYQTNWRVPAAGAIIRSSVSTQLCPEDTGYSWDWAVKIRHLKSMCKPDVFLCKAWWVHAFPSHLPMKQLSIHQLICYWESEKEKNASTFFKKKLQNYSTSLVRSKLMAL